VRDILSHDGNHWTHALSAKWESACEFLDGTACVSSWWKNHLQVHLYSGTQCVVSIVSLSACPAVERSDHQMPLIGKILGLRRKVKCVYLEASFFETGCISRDFNQSGRTKQDWPLRPGLCTLHNEVQVAFFFRVWPHVQGEAGSEKRCTVSEY
jgi:hypothetical protein